MFNNNSKPVQAKYTYHFFVTIKQNVCRNETHLLATSVKTNAKEDPSRDIKTSVVCHRTTVVTIEKAGKPYKKKEKKMPRKNKQKKG